MKSSKRIGEELEKALAKKDDAYRTLLRMAQKCRDLDGVIRRLKKGKRKAQAFERNAALGQSLMNGRVNAEAN